VGLDLQLTEQEDGLLLTVSDSDGITSVTELGAVAEEAKNPEAVKNVAIKQLKKCGGTIFTVDAVQVDLVGTSFYPAAIFNEIRRNGFARHAEARVKYFQVKPTGPRMDTGIWPGDSVSYLDNIGNTKAVEFYAAHGVSKVDKAFTQAVDVQDAALMTTKYCIKAQLGSCPKRKGSRKDMAGSLFLADNTGEYVLDFDCKKCEMQLRLKNK